MTSQTAKKSITKNVIFSILAQAVSLMASFIIGFLVPKFIPELEYSYWQTYTLYVGYTGIMHLGLLDGLVLRYSKYNYDELSKPHVRSQFQIVLAFTSVCGIATVLITSAFTRGIPLYIVGLVSVGMVTKNIVTYTTYTFQCTNRIKYYAGLVIIQRMTYSLIIIFLLLAKVENFYWYCIADLIGDLVAFLVGALKNRGMYFGKALPIKECLFEVRANISCGVLLLISNLAAGLIVSGAKMMIQWHWGTLLFGKIAFAFSVSNLFLTFVTAISVVLFPSLKRMQEEELPELYGKIRSAISPLLMAAMLLYFPVCKILQLWLPKYSASLVYLGILLPIIVFSSKVSLLTNNYLKAYRKERLMLVINVVSVVVGIALFYLSAYVLNRLELLLYCVVLIIMASSIASEVVVGRVIHKTFLKDFVIESLMTAGFIASVRLFPLWIGCAVYAGLLTVYFIINRKSVVAMLNALRNSLRKKGKDI